MTDEPSEVSSLTARRARFTSSSENVGNLEEIARILSCHVGYAAYLPTRIRQLLHTIALRALAILATVS